MVPAPSRRIAVVTSLLVLGISLGTFAHYAAGISTTTDQTLTFDDTALYLETGEQRDVLIENLDDVEQIEFREVEGVLLVSAERRSESALSPTQKAKAKRLATKRVEKMATLNTTSTIYSFEPFPRGVAPDRAAAAIASPEGAPTRPAVDAQTVFSTASTNTSTGVVLTRTGQATDPERILVGMRAISSGDRYGVVVDLEENEVDTVVRVEYANTSSSPKSESSRATTPPTPNRHG